MFHILLVDPTNTQQSARMRNTAAIFPVQWLHLPAPWLYLNQIKNKTKKAMSFHTNAPTKCFTDHSINFIECWDSLTPPLELGESSCGKVALSGVQSFLFRSEKREVKSNVLKLIKGKESQTLDAFSDSSFLSSQTISCFKSRC